MKYSSRGWTAQMPQVFHGRAKQNISVLHVAQRSLKSLPPGTGTASKPKGPFSTSNLWFLKSLPFLNQLRIALVYVWARLGAADPSRDPLSCHFAYELCEYFCLWTCSQASGNLSPPEIGAAYPSGHSKPPRLTSSGLGKLISLDIQDQVCLG